MRHRILKEARRVVLKVGSSLVASKGLGLHTERLERLAAELAELKTQNRDILMVSSGAIISGIEKLGLKEYPKSLPIKQAAAAVGQSRLMWAYEKAFEKEGVKVAQVLLTREDLTNRARFLNSRHTLTALLGFGVVPIINENDTVAVEEIRFGDNDSLAGMVAHLVDADLLVILSDVEGLYTVDALTRRGKSLLPSGITAVDGEFEAGDSVACTDGQGREIAKGLVNYSSAAISKIKGLKSADIQQTLGYKDYDEVIHRDNLVIL